MKIQCPKCQTNYNVDLLPEEMPEEGSKFSCQNCKNQFFIRKKQESSFISLMENIKGKLDDWDNEIDGKALSIDEKETLDINQQDNTEELEEEINQEADELLNEILEEEKLEDASPSADQPHLTQETEMTAKDAAIEKHEKIIEEEESSQIEKTLQEFPEIAAEEQPPSPTEETAAAAEPEGEPEGSDQSDIDKMFAEATSEQEEGTVEESSEAVAEEEPPSPTEEPAAATAEPEGEPEGSDQSDIDKMFAEATSEQEEGPLEESSEAVAEEQSPSPTEEPAAATAEPEGESEESDQSDIDKMFAEATSEQEEGPLEESSEAVAEEQSPSPTEEPAAATAEPEGESEESDQSDIDKMFAEATSEQQVGTVEEQATPPEEQTSSADPAEQDIDALWTTALEEATDTKKEESTDSDGKKPDTSYTAESDKFQNDLENLLEDTDQGTDASLEKMNEKVEAKAEVDSNTEQFPDPDSPVSDAADETVVEGQEDTTFMEDASSEEGVPETEIELSDLETPEAKDMEEEMYKEGMETETETLSESEKEPLKEKILFYKDMLVFFITDKRKIVKFLIPAFIILSALSGGGYWYFSKPGDSEMKIAKVDDKETIAVAKAAKKAETIEPVPAQDAKKAETTEPNSAKESKPSDKSSVVKENREMEVEKKETKQSVIPGATYPASKGRTGSISIGSIVPVVFSQDEVRVMSVNIKLDIDNNKVYEQVKKGFPFFEEKIESTIEKYFEGKFYREIQFVQEKLRKELHAKLNKEIKGGKIKSVELEDFLIQ